MHFIKKHKGACTVPELNSPSEGNVLLLFSLLVLSILLMQFGFYFSFT